MDEQVLSSVPQSQTAPIVPPAQRQGSKWGKWIIAFLLLAVLLLSGLSYFLLSQQRPHSSPKKSSIVLPSVPPSLTSSSSPTSRPTQNITVQADSKPDLVISYMYVTYPKINKKFDCKDLGLLIAIKNQSNAPVTTPFTVKANNTSKVFSDTLAPNATVTIWTADFVDQGETTVSLDTTSLIDEADETNNQITQFVPVPTPPLSSECVK